MVKRNLVRAASSMGVPRDELVAKIQEYYGNTVRGQFPGSIKCIYDATGIKPELDAKDVQDAYVRLSKWLSDPVMDMFAQTHLEEMVRLCEATGITMSLPEKQVQADYDAYIENGDHKGLQAWMKITGAPLKAKSRLVQRKYREYLQEGLLESLTGIYEITGIKPKLSEKSVQSAYMRYMDGELDLWPALEQATGIKPSEETYKALARTLLRR